MRLLKRALPSVLFFTIVAAFQMPVAAAVVVSEDVPVVGGTAEFALAAGIAPPPDRARFVAELARVLYNVPDSRRAASDAFVRRLQAAQTEGRARGRPTASNATIDLVPIPLTAAVWSDAIFHRRVAPADLVSAILADRQAALLCYGLAALDDQTLAFFIDHPAALTRIYADDAAAFASFGDSLRVSDGRVHPPGGDAAVPLWEAVVGESVTHPDRFVRELFSRGEGRLAYLYDAIAQLDPPHAAFALGSWISDAAARTDRFRRLAEENDSAYHEWHPKASAFARPVFDIAVLLTRVRVEADGSPSAPAGRVLWGAAFDGGDLSNEEAAQLASRADDERVDAAWLAKSISEAAVQQRGDRLDQLSFGQRAFAAAGPADRASILIALRAFDRDRMLLLTLDRIGITNPAVYAAAVRHAGRLAAVDRRGGFAALAQFQGAIALVARMARVRSVDSTAAERILTSLFAVPVNADGYRGAVLQWIDRQLRPLTPSSADVESGLIALLSGRREKLLTAPIRVRWEGQPYHLDLAAAEERRLHLTRERQRDVPLDAALEIARVAAELSVKPIASEDLASAVASLKHAAGMSPARSRGEAAIEPDGVVVFRDPNEVIAAAIEDLVKAESVRRPRISRIAEALTAVADEVGANALLSLAYAIDLGDPDGTALLAANVARRHDFGFALSDPAARVRIAWSVPKQNVAPGVPWHVTGSALGLDVALATLKLRRLDAGRIGDAPTLNANERMSFAISMAMMNPFALTDSDRDAIASAIARGRARVEALTAAAFPAAADEIAMDGWRRRAVRWSLEHDAEHAPVTMFSLAELLALGGGLPPSTLDPWGMAAVATSGCFCTQFRAPGGWWNLTGRPQLGLLATSVADLNLHVALVLRDRGLPAAIEPYVLAAAVQDYIDDVRPADNDDWLALVRAAQAVPRERIDDDVAAVTAGGPLVPDPEEGGGPKIGDGSRFQSSRTAGRVPQAIEFMGDVHTKRGQVWHPRRLVWVSRKRLPSPFQGALR